MKWSNFSIPVRLGGAPGATGGKNDRYMVAATLKGLNFSEMELLPTAVRDPKNSRAELQTPPSQTQFLHPDGGIQSMRKSVQ
jgi:hypothetical protein